MREACNRLSRQRSSLKCLYTADALWRAWMPAAWFPAFREKWAAIPFPLPELIAEAEQHEAELGAELDSDEVLERLRDTINVRPASARRWTDHEGRPHDGLRELPELLDLPSLEHPVIARSSETGEVSPEMRELVARGLRAWLKRCLRDRIQTGNVPQRLTALGMEPAARPCLIADPVELAMMVNGWVMRMPLARSAVKREGARAPVRKGRPGGVYRRIVQHIEPMKDLLRCIGSCQHPKNGLTKSSSAVLMSPIASLLVMYRCQEL